MNRRISRLAVLWRRALDAEYQKDPDPNHWRTINGSHVHLDQNGNYDGGAGGKFNGNHHWGAEYKQKSELTGNLAAALGQVWKQKQAAAANPVEPKPVPAPAQLPKPQPPAKKVPTKEDADNAWKKVTKYKVAIKQAKSLQTKKKNQQLLKDAYFHWCDVASDAPRYYPKKNLIAVENIIHATDEQLAKIGAKANPKVAQTMPPPKTKIQAVAQAYKAQPTPIMKSFASGDVDAAFEKFKKVKLAGTKKSAWNKFKSVASKAWDSSSDLAHYALKEYTGSHYIKMNNFLRGNMDDDDFEKFVNTGGDEEIEAMTDFINKSSYSFDIKLVRGVDKDALLGMAGDDLRLKNDITHLVGKSTSEEISQALKGKKFMEKGFSSCGSSKGMGFNDNEVQLNILCPAGTKVAYVEPYSKWGQDLSGGKLGGAPQKISDENESIIQRGTTFRCIGAHYGTMDSWGKSTLYVDLVVESQNPDPLKPKK